MYAYIYIYTYDAFPTRPQTIHDPTALPKKHISDLCVGVCVCVCVLVLCKRTCTSTRPHLTYTHTHLYIWHCSFMCNMTHVHLTCVFPNHSHIISCPPPSKTQIVYKWATCVHVYICKCVCVLRERALTPTRFPLSTHTHLFVYVTSLNQICDMIYSYMGRDFFRIDDLPLRDI